MPASDPRPFLVLTAILDSSARPAAITRSHGDALERAIQASSGHDVAGLDVVELQVAPASFAGLRKHLNFAADTVAVYDMFPLSSQLGAEVRKVAGQFLAAEILWALDEQGLLSGVPLSLRLDLPRGWSKDPKDVHARLVQSGALDLTPQGIETFKAVKTAFEATRPAA